MSEPTALGLLEEINKVTLWVYGGLLTILGWLGSRQVARIDRLEMTAPHKDDVRDLHLKIDSHHKATTERLDRLIERMK